LKVLLIRTCTGSICSGGSGARARRWSLRHAERERERLEREQDQLQGQQDQAA